jgi:nucleoside-diphosphate-sugar epimerase
MRIKDARQTFAGHWIRLALERVPFKVWGGGQLRDFNYVDDVVDALLMAAASDQEPGRVYNLGGPPVLTLKQFAELLREITGCEYLVEEFPEERKSIDIGDYYANYDRIRSEIGWEPKTSIREAVERTVDYYKEHFECYV